MNEQNFKNHGRYLLIYHFIQPFVMLAALIGSIINLVNSSRENMYSASLLLVITLVLFVIWWYSRAFALKAQDRAIRAEENFRHYILTGKPFDKELRLGQIIALRFASDGEMPALAKRAVEEKLTQKQIKQAIQNWRADFNRA